MRGATPQDDDELYSDEGYAGERIAEAGALLGGMAFIAGAAHFASVTTLTECEVLSGVCSVPAIWDVSVV